jgi:hypothetical protein
MLEPFENKKLQGRDRMGVGFPTTFAIDDHHESRSWPDVRDTTLRE